MTEQEAKQQEESHILKYQKIVMYKIFDPEAEETIEQLFLIDVELNTKEYLEKQPCGCDYGSNVKAHQFFVKPVGVFVRCRIQGTTWGLVPDAMRKKTFPWSRIVKRKKLTVLEAKALFASKKFVATPDILIFLATR